MVAYRNSKTGRVVHMSAPLTAMDRSNKWERVDPELIDVTSFDRDPVNDPEYVEVLPAPDGPFDPAEATVNQVNEYLAGCDQDERVRVLQEEAEKRGRRGILSGPYSEV